eukprot:800024-Rhodomonas_salina.1
MSNTTFLLSLQQYLSCPTHWLAMKEVSDIGSAATRRGREAGFTCPPASPSTGSLSITPLSSYVSLCGVQDSPVTSNAFHVRCPVLNNIILRLSYAVLRLPCTASGSDP